MNGERYFSKVSTADRNTYYIDMKHPDDIYSGTHKHTDQAAVLRATDDGWVLLWEAEFNLKDFL